jgi:hypothetical protein
MALQLNMNASGVGRAGEVKYQDYTTWSFDPYLKIFDAPWTEVKTLMQYSMPMVPDDRWIFDPYHSFGAYWMMEDGLWRDDDQIAKGKMNAVFPSLHSVRPDGVGKKMAKKIRDNLPAGVPDEISKRFTAKSTRIGGITTLCKHKDMNVLRVCARSGHSTGTNLDSYRDLSDVVAGLPAAKTIHGYTDIHADVVLFSFDGIGCEIDVSGLIDNLFVCNNKLFKEGGALRAIVVTAAASLVAFHNEVTKDLGYDNPLSSKLRDIARKMNLKDPRFPHATPETILSEWSTKILADFQNKSAASPSTQPEIGAIAEGLDILIRKVNAISAEVAALVQQRNDLVNENAQNKAAIASLQEENFRLVELKRASEIKHRKQQKRMLEAIASPSPTSKRHRLSYNDNDSVMGTPKNLFPNTTMKETSDASVMDTEINNAALGNSTRESKSEISQVNNDEATSITPMTVRQLKPVDDSAAFCTNKPATLSTNKKQKQQKAPRLMDSLISLAQKGFLDENLDFSSCTAAGKDIGVDNMSFVKHSLQLCDFLFSREDELKEYKKNLCEEGATREDMKKAAKEIEKACYMKIHEMLGKDGAAKDKNKLSRTQKTINSFGRLIIEFKKEVKELPQYKGTKLNLLDVPLMDRNELNKGLQQRGGTPPDHRSMYSFFSPRG